MEFHCSRCDRAFDSEDDDPRCPKCLRKSTVVDPRAPATNDDGGAPEPPAKPFWPRFVAAFTCCTLLFFGITSAGSLMGVPLSSGMRLYAVLLGGLLLSLSITLFQLPGMFGGFGPRPPSKKGEDS